MEYLMKHYTYLWEYSRPDQKFPVSNYFSALAAIFKFCQPKFNVLFRGYVHNRNHFDPTHYTCNDYTSYVLYDYMKYE